MNEDTRDTFRFSSRKEYEDEISRIILTGDFQCGSKAWNSKRKKNIDEVYYETLMEEYLKFCETNA